MGSSPHSGLDHGIKPNCVKNKMCHLRNWLTNKQECILFLDHNFITTLIRNLNNQQLFYFILLIWFFLLFHIEKKKFLSQRAMFLFQKIPSSLNRFPLVTRIIQSCLNKRKGSSTSIYYIRYLTKCVGSAFMKFQDPTIFRSKFLDICNLFTSSVEDRRGRKEFFFGFDSR